MSKIDLTQYGISGTPKIYHNPSWDELFIDETKPGLTGYEKGQVTELGAVNVMTGIYTGRSPKDKFFVDDDISRNTIWWTSDEYKNDNKPITPKTWDALKAIADKELSDKPLYVVDAFCGTNKDTRLAVRFIMEVAWQAHFVTNMFVRPTKEELEDFTPDFVVLNASKAKVENWKELGINSETCVAFNLTQRMQVIINTWYGGEMKKGMFSIMNYYLPLKGMASMHCSANTDMNGENTAIFFGLSGTGKTTLSTDPKRLLIGDDEHGWADDSVFNFEGGCYAKCINLSPEGEPEIYNAIRFGALVENVVMDPDTREFDFDDDSLAVNSRVGYPVEYIPNAELSGMSPSVPKTVIFLTADAYGVLPPISKLNRDQAMYYFVSGFTSKVAGTEIGVTEPVPTFSTCFGEPFLPLDPSVYAAMLAEKVEKAGARVYLVNTGWNGTGKRMKLGYTRAMVTAALTGDIEKSTFVTDPTFGVEVPTHIEGVPDQLLIPANTWEDKAAYEASCKKLAQSFAENFKKYTHMSAEVAAAGPKA